MLGPQTGFLFIRLLQYNFPKQWSKGEKRETLTTIILTNDRTAAKLLFGVSLF